MCLSSNGYSHAICVMIRRASQILQQTFVLTIGFVHIETNLFHDFRTPDYLCLFDLIHCIYTNIYCR